MPIPVDRYLDLNNLEIKLGLPQGESFIIAGRHPDGSYDLSIILPWYAGRHSVGAGICWEENICEEKIRLYYESPTSKLIALIRKSLPAFEQYDRDNDLEI